MMQFLAATESTAGVQFSVWLDDTGTSTDPNPAYVRVYTWGPAPQGWTGASLNGVTYTDWSAYCAAEAKLLAAADLAAMQPPTPAPTPLAIQGATF